MYLPYDTPKKRDLDVLRTVQLVPFVTYGIVNPTGPTLCGVLLALDYQQRTSEVLSFYLNPFEQSVTAVCNIELPRNPNDLVDDVETIIERCGLFAQAAVTLVIPSPLLPNIDHTRRVIILLLSRVGHLGRYLKLLRDFPENPWDRISKDMATPLNEPVALLSERDLQEYVSLILEPKHTQEEFQAFMAAWDGAIKFAKKAPSETMPASDFVTIFQRIVGRQNGTSS